MANVKDFIVNAKNFKPKFKITNLSSIFFPKTTILRYKNFHYTYLCKGCFCRHSIVVSHHTLRFRSSVSLAVIPARWNPKQVLKDTFLTLLHISRLVPASGRHGARERSVPDALQLLASPAEGPLPGDADAAARAGAVDERRAARPAAALLVRAARPAGAAHDHSDRERWIVTDWSAIGWQVF